MKAIIFPRHFVSGIIHPIIYLPAGITEESRAHVLLHEQAHIRRRDYLLQPLFFIILALHWFNPFAWMMYLLFVRDMELACDESAVRHAGGDIRAGVFKNAAFAVCGSWFARHLGLRAKLYQSAHQKHTRL